jgi:hypothetical protein
MDSRDDGWTSYDHLGKCFVSVYCLNLNTLGPFTAQGANIQNASGRYGGNGSLRSVAGDGRDDAIGNLADSVVTGVRRVHVSCCVRGEPLDP